MQKRSLLSVTIVGASLVLAAIGAPAQTVVNTLPYTISASGNYVLNANLNSAATSGNLITINASNVTLDFQNHYISGPVGVTGQTTVGVYAYERSNLTIQNGTVAFCATGIGLGGNSTATTNNVDHRITNMRVTNCYMFGIDVGSAPATQITNCQVSQIGYDNYPAGTGINVVGAGITVQGNAISNVVGSDSVCIYADSGSFVRQNQLSNATFGITYGLYQDNLVNNCTIAFDGGTDAGGNVSTGTSGQTGALSRPVPQRPVR